MPDTDDDPSAFELMQAARAASLENGVVMPAVLREAAAQWALVSIAESLSLIASSLHGLNAHGIETYQTDGDGHRRGI